MINKIEEVVKKNPDKIAYKVKNSFITYKDLWDNAKIYADLLKRQGESPVIIYGDKEIDYVISILACIISSRAYIPISDFIPQERIEKIINETNASLILASSKKIMTNIPCLNLEELKKFRDKPKLKINNDIIYIIFTSGTTGVPKGVPITKDNLNSFINWISELDPLKSYHDINVLNVASFSFDLSVADFYYSICNGHTLVALTNEMKKDMLFLDVVKDEKINVAVMTPTFMKICLLDKDFNEYNFPEFKCVYFCGEKLEKKVILKLFDAFPNLKIINAYGPTEATSAVSGILITKDMLNESILPVGDMNNLATDIEIVDGEIVLKGPSVFSGYINNHKGGHYIFNNINCYKTGDIGYIENNKLYCKGRCDNQIKYKGYRIELSDIESNILDIDGVKDCCCIAKCEDDIVKNIKAYVICENISLDNLKLKLKEKLPNYMIPKTIILVEKLPINDNEKRDRKVLSKI